MTLRALQSAANNTNSEAPMTWIALNRAGQNFGSPAIDYDRFAARWESDPILKQLVDRFDGHGLVIKTNANSEEPEQQGAEQGGGGVEQMAKHATANAFK